MAVSGGDLRISQDTRSWRADAEGTWSFIEAFFDELAAAGVAGVCISPGSRSTPLALVAEGTAGLDTTIHLDERSAAFFALGRAKVARAPVVLVCTSGTAAANYLPAIVESHYACVPLIVLTADRPPELRDWGAGQTIDQVKLYGAYVRRFTEVPVPTSGDDALRYAQRLAARAVQSAVARPAGAVHLNWPLREPLEPPVDHIRRPPRGDAIRISATITRPSEGEVVRLCELVDAHERGVVCGGPMDLLAGDVEAITRFAGLAGWPLLADPMSQLRCGPHVEGASVIATCELLLRDPAFAAASQPEVALRLGAAPVSKAQRLWLAGHPPASLVLIDPDGRWDDPGHGASDVVTASAPALLSSAHDRLVRDGFSRGGLGQWTTNWTQAEEAARDALRESLERDPGRLCEGDVVSVLSEEMPPGSLVYLSNSMPIRDVDAFWPGQEKPIRFLGNRGANGIDGVTSSALGATHASEAPVVLLTGDLALLHDLGGLLAADQVCGSLTIVVLDNDGGGIFSFLPIAERADAGSFDRLFNTPHGRDLGALAPFLGLPFREARTPDELRAGLGQCLGERGVSLVRVPIDRDTNIAHFRACAGTVANLASALAKGFAA